MECWEYWACDIPSNSLGVSIWVPGIAKPGTPTNMLPIIIKVISVD